MNIMQLPNIKKLNARKFRRQYSKGNYIVDFFCASEKLVIELDGNPHNQPPLAVSAFVSYLKSGPATPPSKAFLYSHLYWE